MLIYVITYNLTFLVFFIKKAISMHWNRSKKKMRNPSDKHKHHYTKSTRSNKNENGCIQVQKGKSI